MERFEKLMLPITIGLIIVLGWTFLSDFNNTKDSEVVASTKDRVYESRSGEMGAVMVEVTPLSSAEYKIDFNTHSVELDFDFTKIVKLKDDLGNSYEVQSWSGGQGGHHLEGTLVFPKISSEAKSATIVIGEIGGQVLNFEWNL